MSEVNCEFRAAFVYNDNVIFLDLDENARFFHFHPGDIVCLERRCLPGQEYLSLSPTMFSVDRVEHNILKESTLLPDGKHRHESIVLMSVYLKEAVK